MTVIKVRVKTGEWRERERTGGDKTVLGVVYVTVTLVEAVNREDYKER